MKDIDERRLDTLATRWSLVNAAHGQDSGIAEVARRELVDRYKNPVFRYALACLKDEDAAGEILQKFALLVMEGKLHRTAPEKGRLRKYIKTVILNLIRKHAAHKHISLPHDIAKDEESEDDRFSRCCRAELIANSLEELVRTSPTQGRLLKLKAGLPDLSSSELAEEYTKQFESITPEYVRKSIQRGLPKLTAVLFGQVVALCGSTDADALKSELAELDLWNYCRESFEQWLER